MKLFIVIILLFIPLTTVSAQTDYLTLCMQGLSLHPENQRDLAGYYDRKLDPHGDFVYTPGVLLGYDKTISNTYFSHIRFVGSYMSDCLSFPAVFIGASGVFPLINEDNYSISGSIGAGWYGRKNWKYRIANHYQTIMRRSGSVEWIIMPTPELELKIHPWSFPGSLIVSFMTVIYVSQVSAGVQLNL